MLIRESIYDLTAKPKNELTKDEKLMLGAANRIRIAYQIWPQPEQKTIFWTNKYFLIVAALESVMLLLWWLGVPLLWTSPLFLTAVWFLLLWFRGDKKVIKRYVAGNYREKEVPDELKT